jgi:hypothetical protein
MSLPSPGAVTDVAGRIRAVRGQRVLLDSDLAALYGIPTHRLNEAVKRNPGRFPADFAFRITPDEHAALISQIAISREGRGGRRRSLPQAFTEHGAIMAATVLNSPRAVEMSVYVVRAFVRLRAVLASHAELSRKLAALEKSVATLDAGTRRQFDEVYAAIRALMTPPTKKRRSIGFTADLDDPDG